MKQKELDSLTSLEDHLSSAREEINELKRSALSNIFYFEQNSKKFRTVAIRGHNVIAVTTDLKQVLIHKNSVLRCRLINAEEFWSEIPIKV